MAKPCPKTSPGYETVSDRDLAFVFCLKHMRLRRTDDQKGICLLRDGQVIAAVVYDWISDTNMFMHVAAEPGSRWMTREFLYWAFHYPFEQQRVSRVSGWVDANNVAARRFDEHLGFKLEATLKGAGTQGQDACIYVMHRGDCRYV
jgi:RimJ/RimL family protein N-acetyltransferase